MLGEHMARTERIGLLDEPHVAPLTAFVQDLRTSAGPCAAIPDFDPWDGGVAAEVLFLLEAPGAKAVQSGFVSRNNPDETAKNFFELNCQAGILRMRTIMWNVVPWYVGSGQRIRPANSGDIAAGGAPLLQLLQLLPELRAVVFLGRKAERAEGAVATARPDLRRFKSPHPSPLVINHPGNRGRILHISCVTSPASSILNRLLSNTQGALPCQGKRSPER